MNIEELLQRTADQMTYPPTPEIRLPLAKKPVERRVVALRWAIAVLLILLFAASLIAIPPVRAALFDFLKIGAVTIRVGDTPPDENLPPLLGHAYGRTTLQQAQALVEFPIRLPAEWGTPDEVYVQDWNGRVVITVWRDPDQPNQIALALYHIDNEMVEKDIVKGTDPDMLVMTEVHGDMAVWVSQPHPLRVTNGRGQQEVYLVTGPVLIWMEQGITYRLETGLTLEGAVQIAESLE